jgi:hypothetical protein
MEEHNAGHLQIVGQLAREYEQKTRELEEIVRQADPSMLLHQIRLRGELTTDRFRAAQMVLLTSAASISGNESDEPWKALIALCRCFDEMRILFQCLLDRQTTPGA